MYGGKRSYRHVMGHLCTQAGTEHGGQQESDAFFFFKILFGTLNTATRVVLSSRLLKQLTLLLFLSSNLLLLLCPYSHYYATIHKQLTKLDHGSLGEEISPGSAPVKHHSLRSVCLVYSRYT